MVSTSAERIGRVEKRANRSNLTFEPDHLPVPTQAPREPNHPQSSPHNQQRRALHLLAVPTQQRGCGVAQPAARWVDTM